MTAAKPELGIGVVGFGWMGKVHARAFSRLLQHYPDAPFRPRFVAVADTATDDRSQQAAAAFGFEHQLTDWRDLIARDGVDVVCVTGPNFIHRDVAVAAARAGKHLWVEKPAGRTSAETAEIAAAVTAAGVQAAAGFNYRNVPAVEHARQLVRSGRLGRIEHTAVKFCSDYSAHPDGALTWRFQNEYAGSGVLGDLVSHAVDLVRYVVGDLSELVVDTATFIPERPAAVGAASHFSRGADGPRLPVENEDYVSALLRLADGSRATLESSRTEVGDQNNYGIEVHGTEGAISWNYQRMGELRVCLDQDVQDAQYATLRTSPAHGELGAFQPGAANPMSYDDLKVIEAYRLVESIGTGKPVGATVHDALIAAQTVDAMQLSTRERRWVTL
ncbi:Gfo/Idh/MocA family protein [Actinoplanes couchii]|uniref:Oxidoreductase n=1 Tax=Actinoplanes couchii TaxID=403638 RepID=A0ABQ3XHC7_9ACTN|nr:Gfo/Idh/MocA family oxidoreductase [Actinoplanes couchii]MDR6317527.1 putative dehydrogenase [Actinoplanes couchii]GID57909.1 oxidoreductase [Actinoplanes couchii]